MIVERIELLGCPLDPLDLAATVERCIAIIEAGGPAQQMSINVAKIVRLQRDRRLGEIARGCALVNADGQPIVWASRLLRAPVPERVAGIDLMHAMLRVAVERGYRIFVLGAQAEVLDKAIRVLSARYPGVVAGHHHGYFSDHDLPHILNLIHQARPHLLFVAMSSPRKEYLLADNADHLRVPLAIGVGGAIDIVAGVTRRAPHWMQRSGLEWFFRLLQEPRRLGPRYVITNTRFLFLLAAALLSPRTRTHEGPP
jgi:N-acetylglucosaminyldiphosphoundecaprenol N-acetyl-beta-D-mannosaminyltransferase